MSTIWEKFKALPGERKALLVFIPLIVTAMLAAWYDQAPPVNTKTFVTPPAIKGTAVPKVDVPVKTVKVIPKGTVKKAIPNLPPEIDDEDTEVTDTAEVPASENGTKVISTINVVTGETKIITKPNEPSLFAFENKRRIGVGYGIGTSGTTAKLFGEYGFLRIGNVHISVQGEIVTTPLNSPEARVSALADYRW